MHTEVGHRCIGARSFNGRLVALERKLLSRSWPRFVQRAERRGPSRDCVVVSLRAKTKIRQYAASGVRRQPVRDAMAFARCAAVDFRCGAFWVTVSMQRWPASLRGRASTLYRHR